jgi:hypothetical protein
MNFYQRPAATIIAELKTSDKDGLTDAQLKELFQLATGSKQSAKLKLS